LKKIISIFRTFEGLDDSYFYSFLKKLGYVKQIEYINFDDTTYVQFNCNNFKSKTIRKIIKINQINYFNDTIKYYTKVINPDIFIFFKANYLSLDTLKLVKESGSLIIAIYPDLYPEIHGKNYLKVLKLADLLIYTKPNLKSYFNTLNKNALCVNPFYSLNNLQKILAYDNKVGISFIGHQTKGKKRELIGLSKIIKENISVYGDGWINKNSTNKNLNFHKALFGFPVNQIYRKSLFVLGLLTEKQTGFIAGDVITARSVQIPAYGGLVLHKKNKFSEDFFGVNHKMLYDDFNDVKEIKEELLKDKKMRYLLFEEQQNIVLNKGTQIEKLMKKLIYDYKKSDFNYFDLFRR